MKRRRFWILVAGVLLLAGCASGRPETGQPFLTAGYYYGAPDTLKELPPSAVDYGSYRLIYHAFLLADREGRLLEQPDWGMPSAELVRLAHRHGCRIIVSLGGGGYDVFPAIAATDEGRRQFVQRVVEFVRIHGYDGVDLDWEPPPVDPATGEHWSALIRQFRRALDDLGRTQSRRYYLTTALPPGEWAVRRLDYRTMRECLDYLNLMCYDYNCDLAGYQAPLLPDPADPTGSDLRNGLRFITETVGMPKEKLLIGIPFYGHRFSDSEKYRKYRPENHRIAGFNQLSAEWSDGWRLEREPTSGAAWHYSPDRRIFTVCDDAETVKHKTAWAKAQDYGGVFCWAMAHTAMPDGSQPLAEAMRRAAEE